MSKNKDSKKRDMISEEDYTMRMASSKRNLPENDSPDDSRESTEEEIMLGMNYRPNGDVVLEESFDERMDPPVLNKKNKKKSSSVKSKSRRT